MINIKNNLLNQLISIGIIVFGIIFFSLWVLVPRAMLPIYEKQIYNYLKQPLELISLELNENDVAEDIAYLCIHSNGKVYISNNLPLITLATPEQIIENIRILEKHITIIPLIVMM